MESRFLAWPATATLYLILTSCSTDSPTEPEEPPEKWKYVYTDGYHILSLWQTSEEKDLGFEGIREGRAFGMLKVQCSYRTEPRMYFYIQRLVLDPEAMDTEEEIHLNLTWGEGEPESTWMWWYHEDEHLGVMGRDWLDQLLHYRNDRLYLEIPWYELGMVHFEFDIRAKSPLRRRSRQKVCK